MTVRVYPESSHWQICFSLPKYNHKNIRSTAKNKHNCLRSLNCNLNWLAAALVDGYYLHFTLPFLSACDSAKFFWMKTSGTFVDNSIFWHALSTLNHFSNSSSARFQELFRKVYLIQSFPALVMWQLMDTYLYLISQVIPSFIMILRHTPCLS